MSSIPPRSRIFSALFVLLIFGSLIVFRNDEELLQLSGYTMGTTYQLQFVGIPERYSRSQIEQEVTQLLQRLDQQTFSTYVADSELSRLNNNAVGSPFTVSSELLQVLALAQDISRLTDGAFDTSIGPLVNLWGFGPEFKIPEVPQTSQIEEARARVGYQFLQLDMARSQAVRLQDIYVDLSAIAKGYAVDVVAEYFDTVGMAGYFLEIGGELKIKGYKPGGRNWVPAIERPVDSAPQVYEILNSNGEKLAIAGSGDYRNYFEVDGMRYSHEIDPRTGMPIHHNLAAVYVIDQSTARADALATAFMVMGYEQSMTLAREIGQAVYFIVRTGEGEFTTSYTVQFERYIAREG